MVSEDDRAARDEIVRRHMEVEAAGDIDAVIQTFSTPRYDIVTTGTIFDGEARVRERIRLLVDAMPGVQIEATHIHHADDAVIVETRTRGVHSAPLLGLTPTGRSYDLRGIAVFRFSGRDLLEEVVYYDRQTLIDQLTGEVV